MRSALLAAVLLVATTVAVCGCVQRRMTIRSDPPGALVYIDDHEIGTTPISTPFTYYGKRNIRLVKDRYQTLTVTQDVPPPWYQIFPLDFVCENLIPGEIRDHRTFDYQLTPQMVTPPEQLLQRAEGLRRGTHLASGTAPSAISPPAQWVPPSQPAVPPPASSGQSPASTQPDTPPTIPPAVPNFAPGAGGQPSAPTP